MQLPLVAPAPVVVEQAEVFRDLFENRCPLQHFQHDLTGLMVLSNKSMANISRCVLESADKTNLSRFFSEAPWEQERVNETRIAYLLGQTADLRWKAQRSGVIVDDTLCEPVGSLFEYVDRHDDHCAGRYPRGHNLVTTHLLSGAVRFPLDMRRYRRYEEQTRGEEFVRKHFPGREMPTAKKQRNLLHKQGDESLLQDAEFAALHEQFHTTIALAIELLEKALERTIPLQTVLLDRWFLCEEVATALARREKDGVSLLKKNRNLAVSSFTLRDGQGQEVAFAGPHIKVEDLVPRIPRSPYTPVTIGGRDYGYCALNLRVPGLGKVRIVLSFENRDLTGTDAVLVSNRTDCSAKKLLETYRRRWPIEIVQTQMTKRNGFPLRAGGHDGADFHLAVADDDPINEQGDQLSTLGKRPMVEGRADAVAKGRDALSQGGHLHLVLGLGIELAQLLSPPVRGLRHLLVVACECVPTDEGGQRALQQARLVPFQLRQGLPQRWAPGVEGVRQPLPARGPCQFMSHHSGLSPHPPEILPPERVHGLGRGIARRAAVVGSGAQGIASPPTRIGGRAGGEGAAPAGQLPLAATDQAA